MSEIIEHIGVVTGSVGNKLQVLIEQQSACAGCHAREACMAADKSDKVIDATPIDAAISMGDSVIVYGRKQLGIKAVVLMYIIPFVLILTALLLLSIYTQDEMTMGVLSLLTLVPYYLILVLMRDKINKEFQFFCKKNN